MSQNLKTSHQHEYKLYRNIGGALAKNGMGDTDRASAGMSNLLGGKLLNRSLVLVGGGVHTHASRDAPEEVGVTSGLGAAHAAAAIAGKRERKRVGGNGLFGSTSNTRRKKVLRVRHHATSKGGKTDAEKSEDREHKEANITESENQSQKTHSNANNFPISIDERFGSVVETLHNLWIEYMKQQLADTKSSREAKSTLSLEKRKKIASLLTVSEHIGMPVAILECPSRRHFVNSRCVVVGETKETLKVAMIQKFSLKRTKQTTGENVRSNPPQPRWKIAMMPKRGTVFEVTLPLMDNDKSITVRLEM